MNKQIFWIKVALFAACFMPLGTLVWAGFNNQLSADPIKFITHSTGEWGLRLLLVTLAVSPLRILTGRAWIGRLRRMLGLFAFFYVGLHLTTYAILDLGLDFSILWEDIVKRPYITVGFLSFLMLLSLAVTSTKGMIRRMGKRWKSLHQLIYPAAVLGVLHFVWLVKADLREPSIYAGILAILLLFRVYQARLKRAARAEQAAKRPFRRLQPQSQEQQQTG